ncbi:MAG: Fe(3+) ABC transporter substrate-binding protein [Rhodobacteraceae bacterium]|jgi:iron(III) transport system substrate-binding protein|nr:Fe(3+) ABC transporter substrate-binding protein [Paracoccaceae bacterium]
MSNLKARLMLGALATAIAAPAFAQGEINLYSSRHYDTDEALYSDFTAATGITVNRIEATDDELLARIEAEGANSPVDVFITVDTSRLVRAKDKGLFQPVESAVLEARIPNYLQDSDNQWFGFSQRARIFFYDKNEVTDPPRTYADLADPKYKGQICMRSATNVYSQTLLASVIANEGEEAARAWAQGLLDNLAREPQGGDTDQLKAVVSGECDIAISNTYYFARAIRKEVDGLSGSLDMFGWVFPDQDGNGTHVNISGAGVAANAPNRDNAILFLEYLASDQAQEYFSAGNDEYPAVPGVGLSPSVAELGLFRADAIPLAEVAQNLDTAVQIYNELGWK